MYTRIGFGFDVHEFAAGRPLILGGVSIPHEAGLAGHSDADAVLHAIVDAMLGGAGLGDIGGQFPDTDPEHKDQDSRVFLTSVYRLIREHDFSIGNIDVTIVTQEPRIRPYVEQMRINIAADLEIGSDRVNIKATTTENLGFIGRKEGLAAWAVVALLSATD
ncbi:MAG: 2-C-methyl-D-erythritol 2,4-cyclodiphosphate synthase [Acidiferrobacterales bacterium]|nr:2-C-methyl-D-erythritol 2,4-cyclodiphosphate synthase [Acidiferrobacterales bacterium]